MQKIFFSIFLMFVAAGAGASPSSVKLDMQLFVDGKHHSSPSFSLKHGNKGVVEHSEKGKRISTIIEVTPLKSEFAADQRLKLNVQVKKVVAGEEHIVARPKIITHYGRRSEVVLMNEQNQGFELVIFAKKEQASR